MTNIARRIADAVGTPVLVIPIEIFATLYKQGGVSAIAVSILGTQWALRIPTMIYLTMVLVVFFSVKGDDVGRT